MVLAAAGAIPVGPACDTGGANSDTSRARSFATLVAVQASARLRRACPWSSTAGARSNAGGIGRHRQWMQLVGSPGHRLAGGHYPGGTPQSRTVDRGGDRLLAVGVIVWGLIFWSAVFHRKKNTDTELPRQFGYNMPLELVLTVIPFLIISVLFYFTVVVQEKMLQIAKDPEVVIDITSFQWNWKFGYQRVNFKDGTLTYDGADPSASAPWFPSQRARTSTAKSWSGRCAGSTPRTGPT